MERATITPQEWRRVLIWSAMILAISCLPYLIAWLATPAGFTYTGLVFNPWDSHSYLAKMRQGGSGAWQFHLTFTPEPHDGAYIFLYYLALGHLARLAGLSLTLVYHGARLLGGLALLLTTYVFVAHITPERHERSTAWWLMAAGSGLGWLANASGHFAIDLWVPEAFPFFSLLANPHFPLSTALMLVILICVGWPARGARCWLIPGLAGLALTVVQPFAVLPLAAALFVYLPWRGWRERSWLPRGLTAAAAAGFCAAPILLYDYLVYGRNPILALWAAQNIMTTPPPVDVALGLGLLLLLAIPGLLVALRHRRPGELLVVSWAAAGLVMAYVPLALQRRFLAGLAIPFAILAMFGLQRWLLPRLARQRRIAAGTLAMGAAALGSVFLLLILSLPMLDRDPAASSFTWFRMSQDETAGMAWLLDQAPDAVVLAAPRTGTLLPGQAGVRAFAGHPLETVDADAKMAEATSFFQDQMTATSWQALRRRYNIQYVFAGPAERALGGTRWEATLNAEGNPVFKQAEVTIYQLPQVQ